MPAIICATFVQIARNRSGAEQLAKGVKGKQAKSAVARLLGLAVIYTLELELR